jgi:hypothetical protein
MGRTVTLLDMLSPGMGHSDCLATNRCETLRVMATERNARTIVGTLMLLLGIWGVWSELGRQQVRQGLATIGGPDPQTILLFGLLAAAGVAVIVWNLTRPKVDS